MERRVPDNNIRRVMDQALPGLEGDLWFEERVLQRIRQEDSPRPARPRKVKVALVVALVLVLLTATATAAVLLSGKDFVKRFAAPMAQESENMEWTDEELEKLLALAEENGIEITEEMRQQTYKEELLRMFMKADYGSYPAAWPVEEQAWYDEMLVRYGLKNERTRFMPEEGEISEEEALRIAKDYILEHFQVDIGDESQYTRYMQYMLTVDENDIDIFAPNDYEYTMCKRWDVEFESVDGTVVYSVLIKPDGEVVEELSEIYLPEPTQEPDTLDAKDNSEYIALMWLMVEDDFFTVENLASYKEKYGALVEEFATDGFEDTRMKRELLEIPYALPRDTDITPDQALNAARNEILAQGWHEEWLPLCRYSISYRIYDGEAPVYRICYKLKFENYQMYFDDIMPFGIVVYVRPEDGTISEVVVLEYMDERDRYCEYPDKHDTFPSYALG